VILPDVNLLVYAYNADAPLHKPAAAWWEEALSGTSQVGLPWIVCLGFTRLMTSRAVLVEPMSTAEALAHVRSWIERPQADIVQPGPRHLDILDSFARVGALTSTLVTDSHIAALAIELQAEVHSNDGDFSRFPGLRWHNPLA
jgi:toxin-antitoxin system PIN domain toxin